MSNLENLSKTINSRLFDTNAVEYVSDNYSARIKLGPKYADNKSAVMRDCFDDLIIPGTKLFTERAKKFINELANDLGIEIEFMYSQAIVEKKLNEN